MQNPIELQCGAYKGTVQEHDGMWQLTVTGQVTLYKTVFNSRLEACQWAHIMLRSYAEAEEPLPLEQGGESVHGGRPADPRPAEQHQ